MKRTQCAFFSVCGLLLWMGMTGGPAVFAQARTKAAQAKPKVKANPAQQSLQYEVAVTVKLVQVYVTDSKGNPARDLEMPDFVLYDNGKLQTVTGFEKHFLAAPKTPPETNVGESKPLPARDTASLMNRKLILLIDYEGNDLQGIAMSKNAALRFMDDQVQPTDEIALFSYSPVRGMTLHEYFTADYKRIREAITRMKESTGGMRGGTGISASETGHEAMGMELLSEQVFGGHSHAPRPGGVRAFIFSLTDLAKAFRQIPGQKNVILFTKGFGREILGPRSADRPFFIEMSRELASANSPVFTVNTTTRQEQLEGFQKGNILTAETSLEYLSKQTGGRYFDDATYSTSISRNIQDATSNYYVLGYSIESTWDGKFHEIRVEVKRPGYVVAAQRGYFNPRPFSALSPIEKHLQLLDLALGEKAYFEQHVSFPMIALDYSDKKESNTLLISEIPVQKIRETVGDNTEFISLVFDENKTIDGSKRVEIDWGTLKGEKICQYSAAALAPGRYDCRVVIRNLDNGKAAVGACAVEIPERGGDTGLRLYPPLLLVPGREARYLNVSGMENAGAAKTITISDVYPYPPKEFSPLVSALESGAESICAAVRCSWAGAEAPEAQFLAWIIPDGSQQKSDLTVNLLGTADRDNVRVFLLEFELPDLSPRKYTLHLLGEDPATKTTSETSAALSIVPPAGQK